MNGKRLIVIACILGALGVIIGAFGAHALPNYLTEQGLTEANVLKHEANLNTGVRYHMYHALALLGIGILQLQLSARVGTVATWSFLIGLLLFSGGLYVWSVTSLRTAVMIVPVGGLAFIIGWISLAISVARSSSDQG